MILARANKGEFLLNPGSLFLVMAMQMLNPASEPVAEEPTSEEPVVEAQEPAGAE
ncbi:hypothetical protein R69746_07686 [Paraburkholderia aspalathi]|uniref:hypothetical protein n=1 Tax=Paraburkholderia aspalathi TaxID=1324617 RepID=UPI00190BB0C9|nr:hypothetical protein [Paraburkholderia aspalathi]MBK3843675.1 hypothetical protein [Paraburkholderia aspalathi]CAE6858268.1 hypothetical protein R69746_07686 [Paraburkholderia aspalathi]